MGSPKKKWLTRMLSKAPDQFGWLLTLAVLFAGMMLVFHLGENRKQSPWLQMLYEVGFALIVSAVVSAIYELHERVQSEKRDAEGILKGVIDEMVVPGLWEVIHEQIVDKHIFRKEALLRIELSPAEGLQDGLQKLRVTQEYKLFATRTTHTKTPVRHQLNFHLRSGAGAERFPKFQRIVYGKINLSGEPLQRRVGHDGVFTMQWDPAKDGNPLDVIVERTELTNVPGSYYFTFLELTQGVRIEVDKLPPDIEVEICALPETATYPTTESKIVGLGNLFLPGQSIEFRFKRKET
jgi:hypothetical protein